MINIISAKGSYILYRPYNSQDMNYHLVNTDNGAEHLIDICDVYEYGESGYEEGLCWDDLVSLDDIDLILEYVWKTVQLVMGLQHLFDKCWSPML